MCNCPSGWISLDQRDNDLRTFLRYILAAIRLMFPKIKLQTEILLETNPLLLLPVLVSYLQNDLIQIAESFILVLDDYN